MKMPSSSPDAPADFFRNPTPTINFCERSRRSSPPTRDARACLPTIPMPTLLVVDDEPLILDCFRYLFPAADVKVLTASTASEGLKLFEEQRPDVVVSDIRLPDLS